MDIRVGEGWDIHQLVDGRKLILGGMVIPFEKGLLGCSDADVLLHAITDALVGAAGLGDIGRHFPDTDLGNKDKDSGLILQSVVKKLQQQGWRIVNVDSTIVAQKPRLAEYLPAMAARVAQLLAVEVSRVNIKAKTAEKLGPVGQGLAMEARAVALIMGGT